VETSTVNNTDFISYLRRKSALFKITRDKKESGWGRYSVCSQQIKLSYGGLAIMLWYPMEKVLKKESYYFQLGSEVKNFGILL